MSLANLEPNLESKIKQIYIYIYSLSPFKCSVYIAVCVCVISTYRPYVGLCGYERHQPLSTRFSLNT